MSRARAWLADITGGGAVYPLLILFGLNAVDELDRAAFDVLLPEIRDHFGLTTQGALSAIAVVVALTLALQIPVAHYADRGSRVRLALIGATAWALFSFGTGLAWAVWVLVVMRSGSSIGKAVSDPSHRSLLADLYPPEQRPKVFSFHIGANAVGSVVGPVVGGLLAFSFGWRAPFYVFAVPTLILVVLGLRLREPPRGEHERRAMGATDEVALTDEPPPSFGEAWRLCHQIESLRRIWWSLPFLFTSLVGFGALAGLFYEDVFALDERARGVVAALVAPASLVGLAVGARFSTKLLERDPGLPFRLFGVLAGAAALVNVLFAVSPWLWLAVLTQVVLVALLSVIGPGTLAVLSLAIPPRVRALGFAIGSLWVLPGLLILPIIGGIGDRWGLRTGMLLMLPVFAVGGYLQSRAGHVVGRDIQQVWATAAARSEVIRARREGHAKLLLLRDVCVSYGDLQVLFDVDLEVDEGEIVALLGTNGAGKSTLVRAISGIAEAHRGAIIFDGVDMTHTPPAEIAARGVMQVPGGAGVFPSLTVQENLQAAGWLRRRSPAERRAGVERAFALFPVLEQRRDEPAANLSGGQQQMLALGMALLSRPRLLMIDELSLGLAPAVVAQILPVVQELRDQGTTIILVEQSVNVALGIAETAYFMEKGEIRFSGATAELLDRPDLLRSVYLEGAGRALGDGGHDPLGASTVVVGRAPERGNGERGAAPAAAFETIDLTVSFGGIHAVDHASLRVAPGEIVGLIGPNGAGKTTLFDASCGFVPTQAGRVLLAGHDITRLAPHRRGQRGLGRSFQDARLFPAMTVEETLAVSLERFAEWRDPLTAALHLPMVYDSEARVSDRVEELIELTGLGAFRGKFIRELSTGSRRIVDLASIIAQRPTVILLDEPSSGIAQRESEALAPLLARIRDEIGAALLVIEHDIPLVRSVADRLVAMDRGRVIAEGDPSTVLAHADVVSAYLGDAATALERSGTRT